MTTPISPRRAAARLRRADEHFDRENARDLEGILSTFGPWPSLVLNGEHLGGPDRVRGVYRVLLDSFPDLAVEVKHRYLAGEAVVAQVVLRGTQVHPFLGVPASGRHIEVPACVIFHFDAEDLLAEEAVYLDVALLRQQVGLPDAA
jgi:steroid delta-isomerase-like uncharacterized protein